MDKQRNNLEIYDACFLLQNKKSNLQSTAKNKEFNLFRMKPTRFTLLPSIFISTSLHVSGNYVPIIRRTDCIYATLVFFVLYGWLSGVLVGMRHAAGWGETPVSSQPADQATTHTEPEILVSHRNSKLT